MARPFVHPPIEDVSLEGVLYALADPHRLAIFRRLTGCGGTMNCSTAAPCDLPKSTLSHHFKLLREAGLIRSEKQGTQVVNMARCDELEQKFPGLVHAILTSSDACESDGINR
ncbi:MAG: metalloregulator ArsR/SmtB family transcription factor [Hyphomicrobiaceae bacterium]|nr:metalloregulator ArsR/SmtB family transcription factor [Hyphomicrobiaceae bacterium]